MVLFELKSRLVISGGLPPCLQIQSRRNPAHLHSQARTTTSCPLPVTLFRGFRHSDSFWKVAPRHVLLSSTIDLISEDVFQQTHWFQHACWTTPKSSRSSSYKEQLKPWAGGLSVYAFDSRGRSPPTPLPLRGLLNQCNSSSECKRADEGKPCRQPPRARHSSDGPCPTPTQALR